MPTYDYECTSCGYSFDAFQKMSDAPLEVCPSCEETTLRRLINGGAGIIFKGSGFYVNDSKKEAAGASSGSGNGSETSSGSGGEGKSSGDGSGGSAGKSESSSSGDSAGGSGTSTATESST